MDGASGKNGRTSPRMARIFPRRLPLSVAFWRGSVLLLSREASSSVEVKSSQRLSRGALLEPLFFFFFFFLHLFFILFFIFRLFHLSLASSFIDSYKFSLSPSSKQTVESSILLCPIYYYTRLTRPTPLPLRSLAWFQLLISTLSPPFPYSIFLLSGIIYLLRLYLSYVIHVQRP